ncbi:hypothetical protein IEQ34_015259 [Dendrobium chrysotoxum]|uniref:Disease resistance protein winged helix domain-containing protein n=1 Tax=Dendrobium chrysotoxum TaxID=161865 RepID=A0AAV7GH42_DENCH|nr:hypothetical protein IEQ34_015259 [Dendrobium chrysotoxum]
MHDLLHEMAHNIFVQECLKVFHKIMCSIDDLARMWIALGFIQQSRIQGETTKNIERWHFDILVQKSFFG